MLRIASLVIVAATLSLVGASPSTPETATAVTAHQEAKDTPAVLNFKMKDIDGKDVDLSTFAGKVVLIVNTASKCGYTPQYADLEAVYEKYKDKGLVILGFPANEFGQQEPGTNDEIKAFCAEKYSVTFPMFAKVVVKGEGICGLYKHLTTSDTNPKFAGEIKWNFTKFLIGRDGSIINRFESKVKPTSDDMTKAIEAELAKT
jgi:glutathione peroxidase